MLITSQEVLRHLIYQWVLGALQKVISTLLDMTHMCWKIKVIHPLANTDSEHKAGALERATVTSGVSNLEEETSLSLLNLLISCWNKDLLWINSPFSFSHSTISKIESVFWKWRCGNYLGATRSRVSPGSLQTWGNAQPGSTGGCRGQPPCFALLPSPVGCFVLWPCPCYGRGSSPHWQGWQCFAGCCFFV